MARLEDLALEVFESIAAQLNKRDQKSLRLVNRHASAFTKSKLFASVVIPPYPTMIKQLIQTLSSNEFKDIARRVQRLTWNGLFVDLRGFETIGDGVFEQVLQNFKILRELRLALRSDTPEAMYNAFFDLASSTDRITNLVVDGKRRLTGFNTTSRSVPPSLPFGTLCNLRHLHVRPGMLKSFENHVIEPLSTAIPNCPNLTHLTLVIEGPRAISNYGQAFEQPTPKLADIFAQVPPDVTLNLEELTVLGMITDIPPSIERHFCSLKRLTVGHLHGSSDYTIWIVLQRLGIRLESLTSWLDEQVMMYLSSYSGLLELDLDVGGAMSTSSWVDEDVLQAFYPRFFMTAIVPHCESIRILHLSEDDYCSVSPSDISVISRCTRLESLRVAFDPEFWDYVEDTLASLLNVAFRHKTLHTLHLSPGFGFRDSFDFDLELEFDSDTEDGFDGATRQYEEKRLSMQERIQEIVFKSEIPCHDHDLKLHFQRGVYQLEKLTKKGGIFGFRYSCEEPEKVSEEMQGERRDAFYRAFSVTM